MSPVDGRKNGKCNPVFAKQSHFLKQAKRLQQKWLMEIRGNFEMALFLLKSQL
jgi:hypothetical protein